MLTPAPPTRVIVFVVSFLIAIVLPMILVALDGMVKVSGEEERPMYRSEVDGRNVSDEPEVTPCWIR